MNVTRPEKAVVAQNFPASWAPQHKRMAFMASGMFFCIDFRLLQLHWRYCLRRFGTSSFYHFNLVAGKRKGHPKEFFVE